MAECRVPIGLPNGNGRIAPRRDTDPCAVETVGLSAVLAEWVARWNRDHPSDDPRRSVTAVTILHERTMLDGNPVPRKTIENVIARRYRLTGLRTADALVAAVGCPEVFHDGTLTVQPYREPDRATCCGGSMNGSGAHL
jgi:hypothetical protein